MFLEKEYTSGSVDKCRLELCVVAGSATDVVLRFDMCAQRRNMAFVGECENRGGERCRFTSHFVHTASTKVIAASEI